MPVLEDPSLNIVCSMSKCNVYCARRPGPRWCWCCRAAAAWRRRTGRTATCWTPGTPPTTSSTPPARPRYWRAPWTASHCPQVTTNNQWKDAIHIYPRRNITLYVIYSDPSLIQSSIKALVVYLNIQQKIFILHGGLGSVYSCIEYLLVCKSQNIVAGHISGMIATNPETEAKSRN